MNILKAFDEAVAQEISRGCAAGRGYVIGEKAPYPAYMDNASWDRFVAGMRPEHYNQFTAGSGKELEAKDGRPPKMASFASSSQMICRLSADVAHFVFEEQLPTTVGGLANLDGYLPLADTLIFVEAKCREPYSHSGEVTVSTKYETLYRYLAGREGFPFRCQIKKEREDAPNMQVSFGWGEEKAEYFDVKQMICHLLGIATKLLKYPDQRKLRFLYLLYNPAGLSMPREAKDAVREIYESTCRVANSIDFAAMFGYILDYLLEEKGFRGDAAYVDSLKRSFSFRLCDQNTYRGLLRP